MRTRAQASNAAVSERKCSKLNVHGPVRLPFVSSLCICMWAQDGKAAVFSTIDFSFNKQYKTLYEMNFKKMTQTNVATKA